MTIAINPFIRTSSNETEARGFALYVGIDEHTASANGTSLGAIVSALRNTLEQLAPGLAAESYAAVALARAGSGGRNVDIVRTALADPRALERLSAKDDEDAAKGIVIDLQRRKVFLDGLNAELTEKEFDLLRHLVENQGISISRNELIDALWDSEDGQEVIGRTIDVHVRRLRSKIEGYEDIVRTVRGEGYRFDKHPDVLIEGI
ncbi:MAG: winged helix family transcriptional regulator [Micrococcales bacterium]|jgi:DNA-binding winged helix-turn-helix (wHTH) protein|nr:winged helix family transcriptional regulator [Actinomycetota bacterium]NCA07850.1 winged helix family transcriptional regulator [Micrococcales bacterium]